MLAEVEHCDLCGDVRFLAELQVERWTLVRCACCGLVCTSPRYTRDTVAALYAAEYYQGTPDYYRSQTGAPSDDELKLATAVRTELRCVGKRSLDVGCGAGRLVEAFCLAGFQALGIEPNAMAVQAGRKAGRNVAAMNLSDLPVRSQDCITAMHVLEHAYSPAEFLGDCHRVLDYRGLLIVEVPNYASRAARRLKQNWQPLYPDTHLYQFTRDTLKRYLTQAGFNTLSFRKVGGGGFIHEISDDRSMNVESHGARRGLEVVWYGVIREWIWNSRRHFYRIPLARELIRYLYWQVLGQGEFIRVYALKSDT